MMLDRPVFGIGRLFGTREQLDRYRPDLLAGDAVRAAPFRKRRRLVLTGEMLGPRSPAVHAGVSAASRCRAPSR
jgi:hypothetical protein